jgi:hypothetical protein
MLTTSYFGGRVEHLSVHFHKRYCRTIPANRKIYFSGGGIGSGSRNGLPKSSKNFVRLPVGVQL